MGRRRTSDNLQAVRISPLCRELDGGQKRCCYGVEALSWRSGRRKTKLSVEEAIWLREKSGISEHVLQEVGFRLLDR